MEMFGVPSETPLKKVDARIVRDPLGVCRIFAKRGKYKHWFELGAHRETDEAFECALEAGEVRWDSRITDVTKLF